MDSCDDGRKVLGNGELRLGWVWFLLVFFSVACRMEAQRRPSHRSRQPGRLRIVSAKPLAPCVLWKLRPSVYDGPGPLPARDSARISTRGNLSGLCQIANCVRRTLWPRHCSSFCSPCARYRMRWALGIAMLRFPHLRSGQPPARPCKSG